MNDAEALALLARALAVDESSVVVDGGSLLRLLNAQDLLAQARAAQMEAISDMTTETFPLNANVLQSRNSVIAYRETELRREGEAVFAGAYAWGTVDREMGTDGRVELHHSQSGVLELSVYASWKKERQLRVTPLSPGASSAPGVTLIDEKGIVGIHVAGDTGQGPVLMLDPGISLARIDSVGESNTLALLFADAGGGIQRSLPWISRRILKDPDAIWLGRGGKGGTSSFPRVACIKKSIEDFNGSAML